MRLHLFEVYPRLELQLPHLSLGKFPTPIQKLDHAAASVGANTLYIKRDDLSGTLYGGNKVRKLEFLIGDALRVNAKEVMTIGFAGSNHALAAAVYSTKFRLKSTSLLLPQENAHYLRRNLLASYYYEADLQLYNNLLLLMLGAFWNCIRGFKKHRRFPYLIPAGGTCPLGILGYLNAAYELKSQIVSGELPEPDFIYVPLGSMGTSVGLLLGIKVLGLKTKIIPVRVIESKISNENKMVRLFYKTITFIRKRDPTFPMLDCTVDEINIRNDCFGEGYARFTEKAAKATIIIKNLAGIVLNGTYSAKAFSALIDDGAIGILKGKNVLFWNTYNSADISITAGSIDYHRLPPCFHRYFENDVQALDRNGIDR